MKVYARKAVETAKKTCGRVGELIKGAFDTWPKAFVGVIAALIIGYYPLGGKMSESIDKTADYDFSAI